MQRDCECTQPVAMGAFVDVVGKIPAVIAVMTSLGLLAIGGVAGVGHTAAAAKVPAPWRACHFRHIYASGSA